MYVMSWSVQFKNEIGEFILAVVEKIDIKKSVENLADMAVITLPASVMNTPLELSGKIGRGTEVVIALGYDEVLVNEFNGYVREVLTNDGNLTIECEDALFLFRKSVKDQELKPTTLKTLAETLVSQVDDGYTVDCDYAISYEKFTIHNATAFDVLKKIQDETKAAVYFDTEKKVLHIHPPYLKKGGDVVYDMHQNIESSNLEFRSNLDKMVEVTIESTDLKGKVTKVTAGTTGGDKVTMKVGAMSTTDMQKVAESALVKNNFTGYKGTFTGWLVPYCAPSYSAEIIDQEYPEKTGTYYIVSVNTSFSSSGGVRTITPGIKLK